MKIQLYDRKLKSMKHSSEMDVYLIYHNHNRYATIAVRAIILLGRVPGSST